MQEEKIKKKYKVFVVSNGTPNDLPLGCFQYDQAKALKMMGNDVAVLVIDLRSIRRKRKMGFYDYVYDDMPIIVGSIPIGRVPQSILDFFGKIVFRIIYNIGKNKYFKPDVIHSHFRAITYAVNNSGINYKKEKIKFVATEHSSEYLIKVNKQVLRSELNAYTKVDKLISVSNFLKKAIKDRINIDSVVIPNIIDTNEFDVNRINHDVFTFVSVGNLVENKRMMELCTLFYSTFKNNKNVQLFIIGDGVEKNKILNFININNCDNIKLLGKLSRKEIANYFKISDVFILLSKYETFGVAYVEAMTVGLPVIATGNVGVKDFINNKNGIIINDIEKETTKVLKDFMENKYNFNSKNIKESVKDKFSQFTISKLIIKEYNSL